MTHRCKFVQRKTRTGEIVNYAPFALYICFMLTVIALLLARGLGYI